MGPFRLGIVGVGKVSIDRHVPAALACSDVMVTALVDNDRQRCINLARQVGIKPKISAAVADIFAEVDGVIIATPNHTHYPLAMECLQAGIHTLIEKPMANSSAEGKAIVEAGEARGAVVAVGYNTRFDEKNRLMGKLIDSGFFGRIKRFAYFFGTAGGWAPLSGYILDRRSIGGGVVAVSGSHFLDRMLQWFGYPFEIDYADDSEGGPEANAVAKMLFGSGSKTIEGHFRLSKTVSLRAGLVLDTEEGMVVVPEDFGANIRFRPNRAPELKMVIPTGENPEEKRIIYQRQLENFVTACRQDKNPEVTGLQGLESVRLIQEMYSRKRPLVCDTYASLWEEDNDPCDGIRSVRAGGQSPGRETITQ